MTPRVAIIGAGLAGLAAAHRLLSRSSPPEVVLIDKGRHAGGRMCTRAVDLGDGRQAQFDLGPPNLYARRQGNRPEPDGRAVALGHAARREQHQLFARRVVGIVGAAGERVGNEQATALTVNGGMRELAFRVLSAHGGRLDFRDHTQAEKLDRTPDGWRVHTRSLRDGSEAIVSANALILTPPVPQTLELLSANKIELPDELRYALERVTYAPCFALYGLFTGGHDLQAGGVWFGDGPVEWLVNSAARAVSAVGPAVTVLTRADWTERHWNEPDVQIIEQLLARMRAWVGEPLDPSHMWLHRWRWARPVAPHRAPCAVLRDLSAVIAGDGFCGSMPDPVDAAVGSGEVAAHRIGEFLTRLARSDDRYAPARPRTYTLEIAVETPAEAVEAVGRGADRLELSSGLALGGLTPSLGAFREARRRLPDGFPIYVLLRPRPGGFVYTPTEEDVMLADAELFLSEGAAGLVFGALTPAGRIDRSLCARMVEVAHGRGARAVFHRAFDFLPDPLPALDELIELGFDRVLTSGGARTAEAGTTHLAALVQHAGWQIEVLPGGGIRADTVADLVRATNCDQVHAGPRALVSDRALAVRPNLARGMGEPTELDVPAVGALRGQLDALAESLSLTE